MACSFSNCVKVPTEPLQASTVARPLPPFQPDDNRPPLFSVRGTLERRPGRRYLITIIPQDGGPKCIRTSESNTVLKINNDQ